MDFLEGGGECFVGKKDSADYHQEMNAASNDDGAVLSQLSVQLQLGG